jgi:predicted small lipoprotein YifL
MKKRFFVTMMAAMMVASTLAGCGKKNEVVEEPKNAQGVQVESTTEASVVENVPAQTNEDGELVANVTYMGRINPKVYLPHALANGETVELMGTTPAEKQYFEFLEGRWLDESWNNEDLAGTDFYEDIFTAINGGILDRMGATIGDYTETESEMVKVYKGMTPVENEINEDYIAVALCDLAGFNGVNFTAETSIQDAITRDAVCAMAATFERNKAFNTGTYLDANVEGYEGSMEYFNAPATGYDINYAFAVALGLDTENAYDALIEAGYTVFDPEQKSVALIDYDKAVIANAKVYVASMNSVVEEDTEPSTTPTGDSGQSSNPNTTTQPTGGNGQTTQQPTQTEEPTPTPNPTRYHYNHPEAANMTLTEIDAMIAPFLGDDGLWHWRDDASLWDEDYNTRYQEAVDNGWEIPW